MDYQRLRAASRRRAETLAAFSAGDGGKSAPALAWIERALMAKPGPDKTKATAEAAERLANSATLVEDMAAIVVAFFGADTMPRGDAVEDAPAEAMAAKPKPKKDDPKDRWPAPTPGDPLSEGDPTQPKDVTSATRRTADEVATVVIIVAQACLANSALRPGVLRIVTLLRDASKRTKDKSLAAAFRGHVDALTRAAAAAGSAPVAEPAAMKAKAPTQMVERLMAEGADVWTVDKATRLAAEYDLLIRSGHQMSMDRDAYVNIGLGRAKR